MINLANLYNEIVEQSKYTIYCDLDGVLVDFDKGYKKLTGKHTSHADVQIKSTFWRAFNHSLLTKNISEQEYWSKLEWMADGKELWDYIKLYKPYILTAPTYNSGSRYGKTVWVETHLGPVKELYFAPASRKAEFSQENAILIDDRAATIDEWIARKGIGILHVSTQDTIQQLKALNI